MGYDIEKQHKKKKCHAIERIALLMDRGSFREIGAGINSYHYKETENDLPYDGVITGKGKIFGKTVFVFAQDFTVSGGSIGYNHGKKIAKIIHMAIEAKCPIIGVYDSGGARIKEGINALAGCGEFMHQNVLASGVIPQISVVVGPCAGAAAYSPALTDFIFMVDEIGQMYITGKTVIEQVTGETCTLQELGGARVHSSVSGVAHFSFSSEKKCFAEVRKLVDYLPSSFADRQESPSEFYPTNSDLDAIIPTDDKASYDIHSVIDGVFDAESFIEVHKNFAQSMVVGFGKLCGKTVGVVASNPKENSGCIDSDSSDKAARFVRFCDAFDIPLLTLVDTSGYLPGIAEEHNGIIRHGAKLLYAYSESTNIKITVVLRKAYGGAYIAMGSRHLGADYVYACKNATLAVMGADGAVPIINKKDLSNLTGEDYENTKNKFIDEYTKEYLNTDMAYREGFVDEIITPNMIRTRLYDDICSFAKSRVGSINKKHGNIPL